MASPKDPKEPKTAAPRTPRAPRPKPVAAKTGDLTELKNISKAKSDAPKDTTADAAPAPRSNEPKLDKQGRAYATGKRKNAIARVWIKLGTGKIIVNDRTVEVYFARPVLQMVVRQPFSVADRGNQFDVVVNVVGGGLSGQAGAVKHGISKALTYFEPTLRPVLKKAKFLTRDSRVVERKKYGKPKARKSFQFSKR